MKKTALALSLLLCCASSYAGLYKWTDENGKVHYSDSPPPTSNATQLKKSALSDPDYQPPARQSLADRNAEYREKKLKQQETEEEQRQAEKQAQLEQQNCQTARKNLRNLQSGIRLTELNENGEQVYLDQQKRQQRIQAAQKNIDRYCQSD